MSSFGDKLNLVEIFRATGLIGLPDHSVYGQVSVRISVEDVGATNNIELYAKMEDEVTWHKLGEVTGENTASFNVDTYDLVRFNCSVYDAVSGGRLIVASFFKRATGSTQIGTESGDPIVSGNPIQFISSDDSITITGDADAGTIDFQAVASGGSLASLSDVDLDSPAENEFLIFDDSDSMWKNIVPTSDTITNNSSITGTTITDALDNIQTSDIENDSLVPGTTAKDSFNTIRDLKNSISLDNKIDWDDQGIVVDNGVNAYYPSVVYDDNAFETDTAEKFRCIYSVGSSLRLIKSVDGQTWSTPTSLIGLTGTPHHPHFIYSRTGFGSQNTIKYKLWYWNSSVSNLLISTIRYAESADGITWINDQAITQDATLKLITGNSGDWNAATWGFQKVFYQGNALNTGTNPFDYSYVLYYDANTGTTYQTTGLAYSIDGKNWFNNQTSPVLNRNIGDAGAWDFYSTSFASFERDINGFHCWYTGGQTAGGFTDNFGIGYAFSLDGITWVKDAGNPIFSVLDGETYRDERCYTPNVVDNKRGTLYMFYSASGSAQTGRKKLGLATLKSNSFIGVQSSQNLLNESDVSGTTIKDALNELDTRTYSTQSYTENFTLTATDITNKYILLTTAPLDKPLTRMTVIGGTEQFYSVDFVVTTDDGGKRLSWDGYALESILAQDDNIVIIHN